MISYSTQCIEEDDLQAVSKALQQPFLTCGPLVEEFERKIAEYVGVKYAVAVSSGTAALHTACHAAGVADKDEVITSPVTWVSSANAAFYCGGIPRFADIDKHTYNVTAETIERQINKKTKAIIPVDYAGQPCDMDTINAVAKAHDLVVIEDAAEALGAKYKTRKVGSLADMSVFSFHAIKPLTTCEGGMVVTDNEEYYHTAKAFRAYGIVKTQEGIDKEGPWVSDQIGLGPNYRLTDVQCALGLNQLQKLDRMLAKRKHIADIYQKELENNEKIILPEHAPECEGNWYMYPVLVNENKRKEYYLKFREAGIGVGVCFYPVYKNTYYQKNGYRDVVCENAEWFYARVLNLPVHAKITDNEVDYIVEITKKIIQG